jgi:hypothetical protein
MSRSKAHRKPAVVTAVDGFTLRWETGRCSCARADDAPDVPYLWIQAPSRGFLAFAFSVCAQCFATKFGSDARGVIHKATVDLTVGHAERRLPGDFEHAIIDALRPWTQAAGTKNPIPTNAAASTEPAR